MEKLGSNGVTMDEYEWVCVWENGEWKNASIILKILEHIKLQLRIKTSSRESKFKGLNTHKNGKKIKAQNFQQG